MCGGSQSGKATKAALDFLRSKIEDTYVKKMRNLLYWQKNIQIIYTQTKITEISLA
jgi:hypothetical protein